MELFYEIAAKYKRQKRSQNQRIQEAQAAKERLKMFWSKKKSKFERRY